MKTSLTVVILVILTNVSFCQSTPEEISHKFFTIYELGDTDKAIDYLFSNSPYAKDIAEGIEDVKRQLKKTAGQNWKLPRCRPAC